MEMLKVSSKTKASSLAGAIAQTIRDDKRVEIRGIGAGAVNQAIKGVAIARGYLAAQGIEICVLPGFKNIDINDEERTAIILEVRRL